MAGFLANVRLDELLGAQDPGDTPAGQAEALGEAVDDEDVVLVDVDDVLLFQRLAWMFHSCSALLELTAAEMVVPSQLLV